MKDLPERPTFKFCYSPPAPKPEPVYGCPSVSPPGPAYAPPAGQTTGIPSVSLTSAGIPSGQNSPNTEVSSASESAGAFTRDQTGSNKPPDLEDLLNIGSIKEERAKLDSILLDRESHTDNKNLTWDEVEMLIIREK